MSHFTETRVAAIFEPVRTSLREDYTASVQTQLDRLTHLFGPTRGELSRARRCHRNFGAFKAIAPFLDSQGLRSFADIQRLDARLDHAKVAKAADRFASDTIDALVAKVLSKVGDLDEALTLRLHGGGGFELFGMVGGSTVLITQKRILNVSSRGKLFNQWPALIYVDGNKVSQKAFAEMIRD